MKNDCKTKKQLIEELTQARARIEELESTGETTATGYGKAVTHGDFAVVARRIFDRCCQLIGATAGYVALLDEEGQEQEVLFLEPGRRACTADPALPMPTRGLRAEAYRTGRAVYDNGFDTSEWKGLLPEGHATLDNVLFAPLNIQGRTVGLVGLANKPGDFTDGDSRTAEVFGDIAAAALESHHAVRSLAESEGQWHRLVEALPEGVCLLDGAGHITFSSTTAQEYIAALADRDENGAILRLGGRALAEVLEPDEDGLAHEVTMPGTPPRIFELSSKVFGAEGRERRYLLMIAEVTLEREVQERARVQEQLATVGQLATGVAHDFNNILSIMMGFVQILVKTEELSPHARESLEEVLSQGRRGAQLTQQILDFGRQNAADKQPIELGPFLKGAAKLLQRALPESIQISANVGADDYLVEGDLMQLQQMLTNLAVNARDAMPEGGRLEFGLSRQLLRPGERPPVDGMSSGAWVALTVRDTGVGISQGVIGHIFEPFFTTKGPGEGAGLGLAQVYGIVKQHGGAIRASSQVGDGAVFEIYLAAESRDGEARSGPTDDIPRGNGERVLLVEDERLVLVVVKKMLVLLGYRVLTATDGIAALTTYEERPDEIDVVLTDVVMPHMGGVELVVALEERGAEIPVVMMSGHTHGSKDPDEVAPGGSRTLPKPVQMEELAQLVSDALSHSTRV